MSADGSLKVWNNLVLINSLGTNPLHSIELLNKTILAVGDIFGYIYIYNISNYNPIIRLDTIYNEPIRSILLLNDKYFASLSLKEIIFWRLSDFKMQKNIPTTKGDVLGGLKLLKISLNMVSVNYIGLVQVWDSDSLEEILNFTSCSNVFSLETLNNDLIAIGCENGEIRIHFSNTGDTKLILYNGIRVDSLKYLRNGYLACGLNNGFIAIWNLNLGLKVKEFLAHLYYVRSLEQIGDELLVSGSRDDYLKIWNISIGFEINSVKAQTGVVASIKLLKSKFELKIFINLIFNLI